MEKEAKKTMDCLKEYLRNLPHNVNLAEATKPIIDFVGASTRSLDDWFDGKTKPIGLTMLKLRYFLAQEGYCVAEVGTLRISVRQLGELVARGKINVEEIYQEIGFDRAARLVSLLLGDINTSSQRFEAIERLVAGCDKDLKSLVSVQSGGMTDGDERQKIEKGGTAEIHHSQEIIHLLRELKGIVDLLNPKLKHLLSDGTSVDQRVNFREAAGRDLGFDLPNAFDCCVLRLNALGSEKAREFHKAELDRIETELGK